ncbi:MAG TPA: transglycosylase SLT domain-containing protein [Pyrinomonadaceae bacterium]|nr:transglycosylase SLT domain-containing protein [Pyrinomonadaceae bacterium]
MKTTKILMVLVVLTLFSSNAIQGTGQTPKAYEDMSRAERLTFVGQEARRIAREISGNEYEFTAAFEEDIQKAVIRWVHRQGKTDDETKRDLRAVFARGQAEAPRLSVAFKARNVSPLIGIYLPWIESAFKNLSSANSMGAIGMFQFLPKTGERYGLSEAELLDVDKSADAAARYITDSMAEFKDDPMKEALALLSYNRGANKTAGDLKVLLNEQNRKCSICALNADRGKLDDTFRNESVYYVPLFFAAAIIGENPQVFGLGSQPLSARSN